VGSLHAKVLYRKGEVQADEQRGARLNLKGEIQVDEHRGARLYLKGETQADEQRGTRLRQACFLPDPQGSPARAVQSGTARTPAPLLQALDPVHPQDAATCQSCCYPRIAWPAVSMLHSVKHEKRVE
jgi:hypothetical protein